MTDDRPTCRLCGGILSRYRAPDEPEDLCAACARQQPDARALDPEELMYAVAGILFIERALDHGPVHLRVKLAELGVEADHADIFQAVQKLRRRGLDVEAEERRPGHLLEAWRHLWHRRRRDRAPQLVLFN